MRLGRIYVVALLAAIAGLATFALVPRHRPAPRPLSERQLSALQFAALQRLNFPRDFVRLNRSCQVGRCYLVNSPSPRVAAMMPALLRAAGLQPPGRLRAAEPVAKLKLAHWSTASNDPYVIACKAIPSSTRQPLVVCQDGARLGQTLVNVLVKPYTSCRNHVCAVPRRSEVIAWVAALPTNS